MKPDAGAPQIPFVYDIAMGVRPGEDAFKRELEGVMDRRRLDIQHILQQFGVPLIGGQHRVTSIGKKEDQTMRTVYHTDLGQWRRLGARH